MCFTFNAAKKFIKILVSDRAEIRTKVYLISKLPTFHVDGIIFGEKKLYKWIWVAVMKSLPIYEDKLT